MNYFYFQRNGDRYYLGDSLKLKSNLIEVLKKMNSTYPSSTIDYDKLFLFDLLQAVFTKADLKKCGLRGTIQHLDRGKLKFVKGFY